MLISAYMKYKTIIFSISGSLNSKSQSRARLCKTMSLVNVSLKFQTLISEIRQSFLLIKCEKLLQCKSFSHFFNNKNQCL